MPVTVTVAVPCLPPAVALIVAPPGAMPVTSPLGETVAIDGALLIQANVVLTTFFL